VARTGGVLSCAAQGNCQCQGQIRRPGKLTADVSSCLQPILGGQNLTWLFHQLLNTFLIRTFCPCSRGVRTHIDVRRSFPLPRTRAAILARRDHARTKRGGAHFWPFAVVISLFSYSQLPFFLPPAGQQRMTPGGIFQEHSENRLVQKRTRDSILVAEWQSQMMDVVRRLSDRRCQDTFN